MIVKRKDGWYVVSHTTKKNLGGPYQSNSAARRRLAYLKNMRHRNGMR
jgi:hypothetical protein